MKKRYLAVLSALFLTACIAGGCSFSLEEKLITGKDLLTSQIQEYKDTVYKHAADDAPFISYDITSAMVEVFKQAYTTGDTSGLSRSELEFYEGLKMALDEAAKYDTPVEKEKAVHDWIVLNCRYNVEDYENDTLPDYCFTADGVFRYKNAVCDGYQKAFLLAMRILGFRCETVSGTALYNGRQENHAWNAVELDGDWYQVDVTWDDPVPDMEGEVRYAYFNVTDEIMQREHTYSFSQPCTETKYSYQTYFLGDCFAADGSEFDRILQGALEQNAKELTVYLEASLLETHATKYFSYQSCYDRFGRVASISCTQYTPDQYWSDGTRCCVIPYTITYRDDVSAVATQEEFNTVILQAYQKGESSAFMVLADNHTVEEFWEYRFREVYIRKYITSGGIAEVQFEPK